MAADEHALKRVRESACTTRGWCWSLARPIGDTIVHAARINLRVIHRSMGTSPPGIPLSPEISFPQSRTLMQGCPFENPMMANGEKLLWGAPRVLRHKIYQREAHGNTYIVYIISKRPKRREINIRCGKRRRLADNKSNHVD